MLPPKRAGKEGGRERESLGLHVGDGDIFAPTLNGTLSLNLVKCWIALLIALESISSGFYPESPTHIVLLLQG